MLVAVEVAVDTVEEVEDFLDVDVVVERVDVEASGWEVEMPTNMCVVFLDAKILDFLVGLVGKGLIGVLDIVAILKYIFTIYKCASSNIIIKIETK